MTSHRLYTILLVDVDDLFLHWLVINIPGTSLADGQVGDVEEAHLSISYIVGLSLINTEYSIQMTKIIYLPSTWQLTTSPEPSKHKWTLIVPGPQNGQP